MLGLRTNDKLHHFECVNHCEIKAEIGLLLFLPPENRHHIFVIGVWRQMNFYLSVALYLFSYCQLSEYLTPLVCPHAP